MDMVINVSKNEKKGKNSLLQVTLNRQIKKVGKQKAQIRKQHSKFFQDTCFKDYRNIFKTFWRFQCTSPDFAKLVTNERYSFNN